MAKTYSKADLQEKAKDTFSDYPNAKQVYAVADGNIFIYENHARLHVGAEGKFYTFEREETTVDTSDEKVSAKSAIELIKNAATIEELEALGFDKDTRSTVIAAYNSKKEELTKTE